MNIYLHTTIARLLLLKNLYPEAECPLKITKYVKLSLCVDRLNLFLLIKQPLLMTVAFIFDPKRKINKQCGCPPLLAVSTVNYDGSQRHFLQFNIFNRKLTLHKKMRFSVKDFFSKCEKIRKKKSLTEKNLHSINNACSTVIKRKT